MRAPSGLRSVSHALAQTPDTWGPEAFPSSRPRPSPPTPLLRRPGMLGLLPGLGPPRPPEARQPAPTTSLASDTSRLIGEGIGLEPILILIIVSILRGHSVALPGDWPETLLVTPDVPSRVQSCVLEGSDRP